MQVDDIISNRRPVLNGKTVGQAGRTMVTAVQKDTNEVQALKVDISATAAQKSDDEARLEKLNAIRRQLAEGTYSISGKDVAEKILKVIKN